VRIYGSQMSIENNLLFSKDGNFEVFARPHLPKDEVSFLSNRPPLYSLRGHNFLGRLHRYKTYCLARLIEVLMRRKGIDGEYGISSYPIRLYPHTLAVRASLVNFAMAIQGKDSLRCSLKDAARTVATCLAGVEAYRSSKTVKMSGYWLPELN